MARSPLGVSMRTALISAALVHGEHLFGHHSVTGWMAGLKRSESTHFWRSHDHRYASLGGEYGPLGGSGLLLERFFSSLKVGYLGL